MVGAAGRKGRSGVCDAAMAGISGPGLSCSSLWLGQRASPVAFCFERKRSERRRDHLPVICVRSSRSWGKSCFQKEL